MTAYIRIFFAILVAMAFSGPVCPADPSGDAAHSGKARAFHRALGHTNREKDYRALEDWVFAPGVPDARRRARVREAVWVLTDDSDSRQPFHSEKQVWADDFLARLAKECAGDWWAWQVAGKLLSALDGYGVMVDGKFRRTDSWQANTVYSGSRDRARARQCYLKAMQMAREAAKTGKATPDEVAETCLALADRLDSGTGAEVMRLTDLAKLPEINETSPWLRWERKDFLPDGRTPVIGPDDQWRLPKLSKRFADARTDSERILWLLHEAGTVSPKHRAEAKVDLARLWTNLLGVENLAEAGYIYIEGSNPDTAGEFDLHTLKDNETIVVGAHGLSRRTIPEGFRYVEMLRELIADETTPETPYCYALGNLMEILGNRQQYNAMEALANEVLASKDVPKGARDEATWKLREIGPDADFEPSDPFVAEEGVEIGFISREIVRQRFELWKLDVEMAAAPEVQEDWYDIKRFVFRDSSRSYDQKEADRIAPVLSKFFKRVTQWEAPIRKKPNHLQTATRIKVPVREPGHYLVVAALPGKRVLLPVRVARTMIMSVPMEKGPSRWNDDAQRGNFFVIDAVSGRPVAGAEVVAAVEHLFDDRERSVSDHQGFLPGLRRGGALVVRRPGLPPELLEVGAKCFRNLDGGKIHSFLVTNQPLYRPGQRVDFAGWLKRPNWRSTDPARLPEDAEVSVTVADPVGQVIYQKELGLDEFGGFTGSFTLGSEIVLGKCKVSLSLSDPTMDASDDPFADRSQWEQWKPIGGNWTIEVGEFRKPDFRVEVERKSGGKEFVAVVHASYYSGEPMVGAKVKARLRGYPYRARVFPKRKWDHLYDNGYDWPLPRAKWLKGWKQWAVWQDDEEYWEEDYEDEESYLGSNSVSIRVEGVTDEKGAARLVFPKKLPLLGTYDYDFTIRVGVEEFTGRTVGARTDFMYSGRKFEVFAKPEMGFYHAGDSVRVELRTMDSERDPVAGAGRFRVESIGGVAAAPEFVPVWETKVATDGGGRSSVEFTPPGAGQYRCVFEGGGSTRGFVLEVLGERKTPGRYDGVQLIPKRAVCKPGDVVEVLVETELDHAQVWLFEIMPDGLRRTPRLIETENQTALVKIPVLKFGKPEFYLRAATVVDGALKSAKCRIVVPPTENLLDLEMTSRPEKKSLLPGEHAEVDIRVADAAGKPAEAALAVTAFDRSLEDLGAPLPKAGEKLLERFELFFSPHSSQDPPRRDSAFVELYQPGCFFDRGDLTGEVRRAPAARFEKIGEHLWVAYKPPELPNSVGSTRNSFAVFPVTPATPSGYGFYSHPLAPDLDLGDATAAGMKGVALRKDFADRAFWGAPVRTDENGRAHIGFDLPDNLTSWRVQAWAFGKDQSFGDAQLDIPVSKPLQIRGLMPRAAVTGDELTIGALVQNLSDMEHEFHITMEADGVALSGGPGRTVRLAAGKEGRAEWQVRIGAPGTARFRFRVRSTDGALADGAEMPLPVAAKQTQVTVAARAEVAPGNESARLELAFDEAVDATTLRVRVEADPAVGALLVLPDLIGYPYGCTEQTLNRFLPALIAWKAAEKLGLDWESMQRAIARADHPLGWVGGRARTEITEKPTDLTAQKVRGIIYTGLSRLDDMQSSEGCWGWFSPDDPESNVYLTALAVRGLARARKEGFTLSGHGKGGTDPDKRGANWLETRARKRAATILKSPDKADAPDAFVVYVLAESTEKGAPELKKALLKTAGDLPLSGVIHLALAMDPKSEPAEFQRLYALARERMAALKPLKNHGWRWWDDPTELRAWFLKLLVKAGADEETLRREVCGLLALRRDGIHWKSTRDSALCVEAIIDAALHCGGFGVGDGKKEIGLTVEAAGVRRAVTLEKQNLWSAHITLPVGKDTLETGSLPVSIQRNHAGSEPVFVTATASYESSAPKHMKPAARGIEVRRRYFLASEDGKEKTLLKPGDALHPGDLVEVELTMTPAPGGDPRFVHLRDPIPAGLEPLVQLSGYDGGAYRESRTGETHLFVSRLSPWNGRQRYWLRAVTPGTATALPPRAECMYAPEVFGQGGMRAVKVE